MAQKTVVKMYDDIDGEELEAGGRTVSFALDGTTYEIDLGPKNLQRLHDALDEFITKGRKVGGGKGRSSAAGKPSPIDTKAVRAWADSNGIQISARGRLSQEILDKYRAAGH